MLNFCNELSAGDIFIRLSVKADCVDELKVIPINIAFFYLLSLLLFLAPHLLLLGDMIVVDQFACVEYLLSTAHVFVELLQFLVLHFEYVGVGCYKFHKVAVALGGRPEEFELWIVLFSLA